MKRVIYYFLTLFLFTFVFLGCSKSSSTKAAPVTSEPTDTVVDLPPSSPNLSFTSSLNVVVRENQTFVTTLKAEDETNNESTGFTFSISDKDADKFDLNTTSGFITFKALPDYEVQSSYTFSVGAIKGSESTYSVFKVELENLNDNAPQFYSTPNVLVGENQLFALYVVAGDLDGDLLTYTIDGEDAESFDINATSGEVTFKELPNSEEKSSYTFVAHASDGVHSISQSIIVNVGNLNEYTPIFTSPAEVIVKENQQNAIVLQATDGDADTLSYFITQEDVVDFQLDSATGIVTFKNSPDYEDKKVYKFKATVSDGEKSSDMNITINVANVNDNAPVFTNEAQVSVEENQQDLLTLIAEDRESDTLSYSITDGDADSFEVNATSGVIRFKNNADYELKQSYSFNAIVSDGVSEVNQTIEVRVLNLNDNAPEFTNSMNVTLDENVEDVVRLTATDADGNDITYSIEGDDAEEFDIDSTTAEISFKVAPDYEERGSYSLIAVANDGVHKTKKTLSVTLNNVNEFTPVLTNETSVSVDEHDDNLEEETTLAITLSATDEDNESELSFSISDYDANMFDLNVTSGEVTFKEVPDYEEKERYSFEATISDGEKSSSKIIEINIININEFTPSITNEDSVSVEENQLNAIALSAEDNDSNAVFTFSIDDEDTFDINATSGEVTFKEAPDYEEETSYTIIATVSDGDFSSDKEITINIINMNDNTPVFTSDDNATVEENNTTAITLEATDADENSTLTFSIAKEDYNSFDINETTGVIVFKNAPDYEEQATYTFVATVSDGDNSSDQNITINLINLNEYTPEFTNDVNVTVEENQLSAITLEATDEDGDSITFSIDGNDSDDFSIDEDTGVVTFKVAPDFETKNSYTFTATVSDGDRSADANITISISDYIYPFQIAKLLVDDAVLSDNLGNSVSISNDYIVVGAKDVTVAGKEKAGAVYLFKRNSDKANDVTLITKIDADLASDSEEKASFGYSVAIDGDYIVVGSYLKDIDSKENAGIAYLFKITEDGDDITIDFLTKLQADDFEAGDNFGNAVDIDGSYIAIGAVLEDSDGDTNSGSAYLFEIVSDDNITQVAHMKQQTDSDDEDRFASSIAVDGNYVVVGAFYDDSDGDTNDREGKAYLFKINKTDSDTTVDYVTDMYEKDEDGNADGGNEDFFGSAVDIYENYIVVGALDDSLGDSVGGAAYIYKLQDDDTVDEIAKITATDVAADDKFGISVSMSKNYVLIGSSNSDGLGTDSGSAYLFNINKTNNTVKQIKKLEAADEKAGDLFGCSVSIDGNYIVSGASENDTAADNAGSAYLFSAEPLNEVYIFENVNRTKDEQFEGVIYDLDTIIRHPYYDVHFDLVGGDDAESFDLEGSIFSIPTAINYEDRPKDNSYEATVNVLDTDDNVLLDVNISIKIKNLYFYYPGADKNGTQNPDDSDIRDDAQYGFSVGVSGEYIVVGANQYAKSADSDNANEGGIYMYRKTSASEVENLAEMQSDANQADEYFGYSVAMSGDYIVSSGPYFDTTNSGQTTSDTGRIYLIKKDSDDNFDQADTYDLEEDSDETEVESDHLGWSVDINGSFVIVGVPDQEDEDANESAGLAYMLKITSDDTFDKTDKFKADETVNGDKFGWSMAMNDTYVVVGAPWHDVGNAENAGEIYMFKYDSTGQIVAVNDTDDYIAINADDVTENDAVADENFGYSVDINDNYIIIGAIGHDSGRGSAYVFEIQDDGTLESIAKITADDAEEDDQFGYSVSVTDEYVLVGANKDDSIKTDAGSAYIFKYNSTTTSYMQVEKLEVPEAKDNDEFATSAVLTEDFIVIGNPEADSEKGDIYIFNKDPE